MRPCAVPDCPDAPVATIWPAAAEAAVDLCRRHLAPAARLLAGADLARVEFEASVATLQRIVDLPPMDAAFLFGSLHRLARAADACAHDPLEVTEGAR